MSEHQDEKFDEFVQAAAKGYNPPPATPRDQMWTAIVAGRRSRSAEQVTRRRWTQWAVGIAAVLVVGVALGRLTAPAGPLGSVPTVAGPTATYQAVAGDHFGRVETLLTLFRASARDGRADEHVTNNARALLVTNRLLMDSPVAGDPRMKQLLEDLDLVLAQIAQISAERGMDPTDLIVRALEDNGVLMRLRSAAPAGSVTGARGAL